MTWSDMGYGVGTRKAGPVLAFSTMVHIGQERVPMVGADVF